LLSHLQDEREHFWDSYRMTFYELNLLRLFNTHPGEIGACCIVSIPSSACMRTYMYV